MLDLLKQSIFTSVGLACLAGEKVEQLAAEVARRAELSEQEANDFQAELVRRAEQAKQELLARSTGGLITPSFSSGSSRPA